MSLKAKINDALSNISVSNELDKRIMKETIYKKKLYLNNYRKFLNNLCIVFIIFFSMIIVVSAKNYIFKYILNKSQRDDGSFQQSIEITKPVSINQVQNYSCESVTTLEKLENDLDIKFVFDTKKYNGKIDQCNIKINENNKIESVKVRVSDFYNFIDDNNSRRKKIDIYIFFMTSEANEKTKMEFKDLGKMTGTSEIKNTKFFAKNINTEGFYFILPSERIQLSKTAIFTNNNILYYFEANKNVTINELLNIIYDF